MIDVLDGLDELQIALLRNVDLDSLIKRTITVLDDRAKFPPGAVADDADRLSYEWEELRDKLKLVWEAVQQAADEALKEDRASQ
jgi:hypothetical protein